MRKILFILLGGMFVLTSCEKKLPGHYIGGDYVQFYYAYQTVLMLDQDYISSPVEWKYVQLSPTNLQDTVYFRLHITGNVSDRARKVNLEQYRDSTSTGIYPEPGVNYVAFDDPIMQEALMVPADSAYVNIPIIMKYDPETAGTYQSFQLHFKLVDSEDLQVGEIFLSKASCWFYQN